MILNNKLYIASASPRRHKLLNELGFELIPVLSEIDETARVNETASNYVQRLALEKGQAALVVAKQQYLINEISELNYPLLSADTTVALDNQLLGKPSSEAQAKAMLQKLSGRTHQVYTAVSICSQGDFHTILHTSDVSFKSLSEQEIDAYIADGEPMDKAGSYGIQGLGGIFITHLSGSFTGVMGLPVYETCELLKALGCAPKSFRVSMN